MPIALYQTSIREGESVALRPRSPYYSQYGEEVGKVEEVVLTAMGHWEVKVKYLRQSLTVDCRQLKQV